ncbi:carboxylesterase, partial [Rhyzopertha dominica]
MICLKPCSQWGFFLSCISYCLATAPEVRTKYGTVRGTHARSYEGKTFSVFEGIPYAKPPVGSLRFEPPQNLEPWDGILQADKKIECIQRDLLAGEAEGVEDCLVLNIYVPSAAPSSEDSFEVIAHVHGGGFSIGSGPTTRIFPHYLVDRNIILVTMNYRLGPFGFMSTQDEVVPGNMGMKDQVASLKWIQENIKSFGGNPDSVTLDGFSAGAAAIHLHYFSPLSKGLFHRGYSHSGAALSSWAVKSDISNKTYKLADAVGCKESTSRSMIDCMKLKSELDIINGIEALHVYGELPLLLFAPVLEENKEGSFLTEHPFEMLRDGKLVSDVPWINSFTPEDGNFAIAIFPGGIYGLEAKWNSMFQHMVFYDVMPGEDEEKIAQRIREFYFGQEKISEDNLEIALRAITSKAFAVDGIIASKIQNKISPVYHLIYNFKGTEGYMEGVIGAEINKGVGHGDDLRYLFANDPDLKLNDVEEEMKNIMLDMMVSYAKTG